MIKTALTLILSILINVPTPLHKPMTKVEKRNTVASFNLTFSKPNPSINVIPDTISQIKRKNTIINVKYNSFRKRSKSSRNKSIHFEEINSSVPSVDST